MDYLILFICSFVSSIMTMIVMYLTSARGTLRIDHSNPEKDIYRLDLDNVCSMNKKTLLLKIDHRANFTNEYSQK